jgi:aminoglycoside phosphotransferase (APT) family kinase protein
VTKPSDVHGVEDGAPPPVFSKGRDLDATRRALEPWLAERLGAITVTVGEFAYPAGAGVSNETLLFEARWTDGGTTHTKELVLRVHPAPEYQVFLETEFRTQFDVLALLHREGLVRVAEVHWYEDDPSVLGRPFFVMERLHGNVPVSMPVYNATGFLVDATPEQRRRLWYGAMEQLCAIATVPTERVAFLDRPDWGATGHDQQLDYWDRYLAWSTGGEPPEIMVAIREWLAARAPDEHDTGLAWGDARIGNMMFADDFTVAGVMDWEQVSLGGPMMDLGWWLLFDDFHSVDHGIGRLDGLGTRQETVDLWTELTGRKVQDLHWHEVYAGWRVSAIAARTSSTGVTDGQLRRKVTNPFLTRTCLLADLELPSEDP